MFGNNNRAVCRKLVKSCLTANRSRNVFIILAVTLTTFMIGAVFSIGTGLMASMEAQQLRLIGSAAHAALGNPTVEQYMKAQSLPYVKHAGYGVRIGWLWDMPALGTLDANLIYMDEAQWKHIQAPAVTDIAGQPPQAADEIMLPRYVLDKMGISSPDIGMDIPLRFTTDGGVTVYDEVFRLSGYFTSYMQASTGSWQFLMLSSEAVYAYEKPAEPQSALNFLFEDGKRTNEYIERLKADLAIGEAQMILPSPMYGIDLESQAASLAVMLILTALFALTGFLLIYNVLHISVSRDIRFFGLLKTIGATPRQIRRIVVRQVLRLCAVGIPAGLALAALASFAAVPAVVLGSEVETGVVISFSPFIYLGAAFFALLTALAGAVSPADKAARISPIEALRFTPQTGRATAARASSVRGKPLHMALRSILREKQRAAVVLCSLFLGLTVFVTVISVIAGMDVENYVARYYAADFMLENTAYARKGDIRTQVISGDISAAVNALPGLESVERTTSAFAEMPYTAERFGAYLDDFAARQRQYGVTSTKEELAQSFIGIVAGLDAAAVERLNESRETPIDLGAFTRGEIVLIATDSPGLFATVPDVHLTMEGSGRAFTAQVGGFVPISFKYIGEYIAPTVFVSNTMWETLGEEPLLRTLHVNVADARESEAEAMLKALLADNGDIDLVSKADARKGMEDAKIILTALGGGLSLILAFIGVMNFINAMSVNVLVRRREFAVLQSVGMTGRTLRAMLRYEGLLYALASLGLVATAGNGIALGLFKLFQRQADYIVFQYPLLPVTAVALLVLAVCVLVPELAYRSLSRATIVERLRDAA